MEAAVYSSCAERPCFGLAEVRDAYRSGTVPPAKLASQGDAAVRLCREKRQVEKKTRFKVDFSSSSSLVLHLESHCGREIRVNRDGVDQSMVGAGGVDMAAIVLGNRVRVWKLVASD